MTWTRDLETLEKLKSLFHAVGGDRNVLADHLIGSLKPDETSFTRGHLKSVLLLGIDLGSMMAENFDEVRRLWVLMNTDAARGIVSFRQEYIDRIDRLLVGDADVPYRRKSP